MIAAQATDSAPQWLLLDVPGMPQAGASLRQQFAHARWFRLFEGTEFHPLRELGPVLVDLRECPALAELCQSAPHAWSGLLLVSEASPSQLLEHL